MTTRDTPWVLEKPLRAEGLLFLTGPRRTGRTHALEKALRARKLAPEKTRFDLARAEVRRRFRESIDWLGDLRRNERALLVFDDAHRMPGWEWTLKTVYDQFHRDFDLAVSLNGAGAEKKARELGARPRRVLPYTPGEIERLPPLETLSLEALLDSWSVPEDLLAHWEKTGGFPEPFLAGTEAGARRWWEDARARMVEEDVRDLTRLESADLMSEILEVLPMAAAKPLSIAAVRDRVGTSFPTAKRYVAAVTDLHFAFALEPFSEGVHRPITLEKKLYFYHPPALPDPAAAFENRVALLLQRWCEERQLAGEPYELRYLRDQDRREVDFVLLRAGKPVFLFDAESGSNSLRYYCARLRVPGLEIVRLAGAAKKIDGTKGRLSLHALAGALG